jgi:hypothetical protein
MDVGLSGYLPSGERGLHEPVRSVDRDLPADVARRGGGAPEVLRLDTPLEGAQAEGKLGAHGTGVYQEKRQASDPVEPIVVPRL